MGLLDRHGNPAGRGGLQKQDRAKPANPVNTINRAGKGLVRGYSKGADPEKDRALREAIELAYDAAGVWLTSTMAYWTPIQLRVEYRISNWIDKHKDAHTEEGLDRMAQGLEKAKQERKEAMEKHLAQKAREGMDRENLQRLRKQIEQEIEDWFRQEKSGPIAYTDGFRVFFGPRYITDLNPTSEEATADELHESLGDHTFVLLHELVHIGLDHPARGVQAMKRSGIYSSHEVMNICADAYVNEIIIEQARTRDSMRSSGLNIPEHGISSETIAKMAAEMCMNADPEVLRKLGFPKGLDLSQARTKGVLVPDRIHEKGLSARKRPFLIPAAVFKGDIADFDFIELHDLLVKLYVLHAENLDVQECQLGGTSGAGEGRSFREGDPGDLPQNPKPFNSPQGEHMKDLAGHDEGEEHEESPKPSEREAREMREAMRNGIQQVAQRLAGSKAGSFLQRVTARMNRKPAWWHQVEPFLRSHLTHQPEEDHQKPARSMLVANAVGIRTAYSPGINHFTPSGTAAICVDTSGSVSDDEIATFGKHLFSIAENTNSKVHVIAGDVAPRNVYLDAELDVLTDGGIDLGGRGGTEFQPLIQEAARTNPDVIIYLTDGYATFGEDPRIPFFWIITQNGIDLDKIPWGRKVKIAKEDE